MARYIITNRPEPIDFEIGGDFAARVVQNAKNLLMCRMGEVPYDRYRGFDQALYSLPMQKLMEELLPELDRVMLWEPNAEVVDAECALGDDGNITISVTIEIEAAE